MSSRILFSPVGGTDPMSLYNCRDGSLLHICRVYRPEKVYLYMSKEILDNLGGNMRTIIYGSASSDKKVIHLFNTIGIDMIQGYGLTETSPVISCENDKYHKETGSSGFPLYN